MPGSRRVLKVAEAIREVVSMAILTEMKDPRVHDVTVTHVEVSPDLRHAKVHVSIMGDDKQQHLTLRGLQHAAGFLQSKVAARIDTRYIPRLEFKLDMGVKKSIEIAQILKRVLPHDADETAPPTDEAESADDGAATEGPQAVEAATDESDPSAADVAPPPRPRDED